MKIKKNLKNNKKKKHFFNHIFFICFFHLVRTFNSCQGGNPFSGHWHISIMEESRGERAREREILSGRKGERAAHLTIHWHESEPLKLTNSERKLQFCAFVSICMSKGNWEIVLQCQVLLAVFSLWWDQNHFFTGSERPDQALLLSQPHKALL